MSVTVPTMVDHTALMARVLKLENAAAPSPPPPPPPPPAGQGIQAKRVADCIELFGVNTFSSMDANANRWGSWPADYSPPSVIDALKWLAGTSNFSFGVREYHYADRAPMQRDWIAAVKAALSGSRITMCVGAGGGTADAQSLVNLPSPLSWLEGVNEPNNDFGQGTIKLADTEAVQVVVRSGGQEQHIMGPSIIAGMPHPEAGILAYCDGDTGKLNALMGIGNGHFYPPDHTDAPGVSMGEYIGGLWTAYGKKPIALTEYHPSLYNMHGRAPKQAGWDGNRDAFYMLTGLFRAAKSTVLGLWWYALFDYGTTYLCGLFPQGHANNPRPAAAALRNLASICADPGAAMRTFTPGYLPVTFTGPADASWDLWQKSDGTWIIPVWRSAPELGGPSTPVSFQLPGTIKSAQLFNPLDGSSRNVNINGLAFFGLDAGAYVLVVKP